MDDLLKSIVTRLLKDNTFILPTTIKELYDNIEKSLNGIIVNTNCNLKATYKNYDKEENL